MPPAVQAQLGRIRDMKPSQVAYWLWSVGTVLIVLSWCGLVSRSIGWGGFAAALIGSLVSFMWPTKKHKVASERELELARQREQALEKSRQRQELASQLQEMSRQNLERQAKLLEKWEEQTRRMDAILTKWEQR